MEDNLGGHIILSFPYSYFHSVLFLEAQLWKGQYRCQNYRDGKLHFFLSRTSLAGEIQTFRDTTVLRRDGHITRAKEALGILRRPEAAI